MEDSVLLYSSILLFAVISWAVYKFVLTRPPATATSTAAVVRRAENNNNGTASSTAINSAAQQQQQQQNNSVVNNITNSVEKEESFISYPQRHPPHLNISKQQQQQHTNNGDDLSSTHLYHGIIPFKSTFASGYETRLSKALLLSSSNDKTSGEEDLIITNRKQRARLFAKLFTIADRPPNRGSNVVVIIKYSHITGSGSVAKCEKLQKSLMLLGTYYNLFLLVDYHPPLPQEKGVDNSHCSSREVVKQFRNDLLNIPTTNDDNDDGTTEPASMKATTAAGTPDVNNRYKLTPQIIPLHRIIFTSTPEGQIAFVRQLHETKLVLLMENNNNNTTTTTTTTTNVDDGNKVKVELERFGFRVVTYPDHTTTNGGGGGGGVSALGQFLIP